MIINENLLLKFILIFVKKKTMKKFLKGFAIVLASVIVLAYIFGYDYLFKGVAKTYLRGETSAAIDDGKLFDSRDIRTSTPQPWALDSLYNQQKLPSTVVDNLEKTNTASLLIIKKGKLLHEEYWNGYQQERKTNSFSMAKGITVMLLGKAIEDKKIKNINQKYADFYTNYGNLNFGKHLTLKHLATMEAGLNWDENYKNPFKPNAKAYYGNSLAKAVFLRSLKEEPGKKFEYQSGATQLLGFAVRQAVEEPLATYLSEKFWIPLGMESNAYWSTDQNGMEKTFCCIHGIARDYAKIGEMMRNNGKHNGKQILDSAFIQKMITPTKASNETYGMGIWINYDNPIKYYFFLGLQGQYIIVIPEKEMVIVKTGSYKEMTFNDKGRPDQVKFLVNELSGF